MKPNRHTYSIGSGTVVALGLAATAAVLFALGRLDGWNPTWRAFGVTPLQPPFFDMHVINDYAACASKGIDPYAPQACNPDNFNIPPTWLLLGSLGVDGSDSVWLSAAIIAAAAAVMVPLLGGRSWHYGAIALPALISPSVLMGVERGNLDLLILALVGLAGLIYAEGKATRACAAMALLGAGVALKLFPMFCVALAARFSRQAFIFACVLAALSLIYLELAMKYVLLIRRNVPTTFILSYGYKAIFLGLDHLRGEAGLSPAGLADTWLPAGTAALVLVCAAVAAAGLSGSGHKFLLIDRSAAGTAFLFGAGIYCGTYLLGTNFVYRLMFLLLCVPQLLDWQAGNREGHSLAASIQRALFATVLGVLWLNGSPDGHAVFVLLPQLLNWFLFFCMAAVLMANLLRTAAGSAFEREPQLRSQ
jgi:hypothetical protein